MGTGLSAVVLSIFLAQAPPSTLDQWKAKWVVGGPNGVTGGVIVLTRNPSAPLYHQHDESLMQCRADLAYIAVNGPAPERSGALEWFQRPLFHFNSVVVDP